MLGIETSCDDTAAAVVEDGCRVRASVATNQDAFHAKYGGIVPEIAGRQHVQLITATVEHALETAGITLEELDGIAVTRGPGLIGSLVVGVASGKALAYAASKPLYAVNHLHGHLYAAFLEQDVPPQLPMLGLIVSGGHTQLVDVRDHGDLRIIGRTLDDAAGEAFDKTARLLGLGFPGGPAMDRLAQRGDAAAIDFPRSMVGAESLDFSFSGLKTSARYFLESPAGKRANPADVAASFQAAVVDILVAKTAQAQRRLGHRTVVVAGGVAANSRLRAEMAAWAQSAGVRLLIPPLRFCTDNAAMIAAAAYYERRSAFPTSLSAARAVSPLKLGADPNLPF
ncbi:MAG TPA: tRNA (adenosine(37)-N6)-threonylcarbamoyltransferase complex transferase subunit TsaD [Candidatus Dormibacteraeota bacterium]|nr:tRNA (adenosine(37)-N6)-threonylcarbamoyltransferase complex transferase subunit TsaD [Candidatus Dormibacteraeota bacterium]